MTEILLQLNNVSKRYSLGKKKQKLALNHINLTINQGEILGIVGESGSGKSTLAHVIMGAVLPTEGQVYYRGQPLKLKRHQQRKEFAKHAQMIFQDLTTSLDPHMKVESIIAENLEIHSKLSKQERKNRVEELMELTNLPKESIHRFPHEFSGGQRQRIGIARALAMNPEFVICDEPISALDISVRSQILNLLLELKETLGLTYLFISHDLQIVHHISDRIAVMVSGNLVELASAQEIGKHALHPYTTMLLDAVLLPIASKERMQEEFETERQGLTTDILSGCPFAQRCHKVTKLCREINPILTEVKSGHFVACHHLQSN